uniref:Uncharacterized protein n=1 Tax=Rhizophora mucronata TaxID=61149 RepID=A0A2P2QR22_RHIMU
MIKLQLRMHEEQYHYHAPKYLIYFFLDLWQSTVNCLLL